MKKLLCLLLALTLVFALVACGAAEKPAEEPAEEPAETEEPAANTDPIKIGLITDRSADGSVLGTAVYQGAQLCVDNLNADGGINGRKIEFFAYDNAGSSDEAINLYKRLCEVDGVCAILGPCVSNVGLAVAPYTNEYKVPFVGLFGDPRCMIGENLDTLNPYMFLVQCSSAQSGITCGAYMHDEYGYNKVAFLIAQDHAYCVSQAEYFKEYCEEKGIEIVATEYCNKDDTDVTVQLINIKNSGAEYIFNACPTQTLVVSHENMFQLGMSIPCTGSMDYCMINTLVSTPEVASNIVTANNYNEEDPKIVPIKEQYNEVFGEGATQKSYLGYDEALILCTVIGDIGSDDPADIAAALSGVSGVNCLVSDNFCLDAENNMPLGLGLYMYSLENGEYAFLEQYAPAE